MTTSDAAAVPATAKTEMTYWDSGWAASSKDPGTLPRVHFDYTAEGWQRLRTPELPGGGLNLDEQQIWTYFVDGMLEQRADRHGQLTSYAYDANNNLRMALDAAGILVEDRSPVDVQATWDSLDRLTKMRSKEESAANYRFTTYAYDLNGNVTRRDDEGVETPAGGLVTASRRNDYTYDAADWLSTQIDYGTGSGASDDQRITNTFFPTGWEQSRVVARNNGSGSWVTKQTTIWTHFLNGRLNTLVTKNGAGATIESHTVDYLDAAGDYVNGHRTNDVFTLLGPDTAAPCRTSACTATYLYDPRDRLVREVNGHGATTNYTLDSAGNVTRELVTGDGAKDVTYAYAGNQLTSATAGGSTQKYWYEPTGNLDCVTLATGTQANCVPGSGGTYSPQVLADYQFDYLDRLERYRTFTTDGSTATPDDKADYEYDALDRVVEQTESHSNGSPRTTLLSYLGLGNQVSGETQHNGDDAGDPLLTTKTYGYDAYGHGVAMTNTPAGGATATYIYGHDVHGSVSLLLADTGSATASYGYRAYGGGDAELTKGDVNVDSPLNAIRYSARRLDSGSGSIDMGARRFGADNARFLQRDFFNGALADLSLALDPLTQNRYALASGNPISFVEWDGHVVLLNGGGGSATTPNPYVPPTDSGDPSTITDDSGGLQPCRRSTDVRVAIEALQYGWEGPTAITGIYQSFRRWTSTLGAAMHNPNPVVRSRAASLLPRAGRFTSFVTNPTFRFLARGAVGVGLGLSFVGNLAEGDTIGAAAVETGVEATVSVGAGIAAGALVCGAAAIATLGIGGAICAGAVLGAGFVGAQAGSALGDVITSDPVIHDAINTVEDSIGDAVDWLTFWDN